jgi:aminoglycoside phosphotransferase (APT) family kinase protein
MLDLDRVAPFLLELGLIDPTAITEGELTIVQVARRNRNFRVELAGEAGWHIKQPGDPAGGGHETLRLEAEFHRLCRSGRAAAPVDGIVPRLVHARMPEAILVFERIAGADSFASLFEGGGRDDAGVEAARGLGAALGTVHRAFAAIDPEAEGLKEWLPRALPWSLRPHEPSIARVAHNSPAVEEALRILQDGGIIAGQLDAIRASWQATTVIHGDIKFANILARTPGDSSRASGPWIVDWEMVQHGDPAWDLAGALQDFLHLWVGSMPLAEDLTAEQRVSRAEVPLSALRPAIAAMWSGYQEAVGLDGEESPRLLGRAVRFSAARLFQTALERTDGDDVLSGHAVILLQLGANLLADPGRGQVQLYGLPPIRPAA